MSAIGLLARAAAPVAAALLLLALGSYRELVLLLAALGVVAVLSFWAARTPALSAQRAHCRVTPPAAVAAAQCSAPHWQ